MGGLACYHWGIRWRNEVTWERWHDRIFFKGQKDQNDFSLHLVCSDIQHQTGPRGSATPFLILIIPTIPLFLLCKYWKDVLVSLLVLFRLWAPQTQQLVSHTHTHLYRAYTSEPLSPSQVESAQHCWQTTTLAKKWTIKAFTAYLVINGTNKAFYFKK